MPSNEVIPTTVSSDLQVLCAKSVLEVTGRRKWDKGQWETCCQRWGRGPRESAARRAGRRRPEAAGGDTGAGGLRPPLVRGADTDKWGLSAGRSRGAAATANVQWFPLKPAKEDLMPPVGSRKGKGHSEAQRVPSMR